MKKLLVSCDEYIYSYNGLFYLNEFGITLIKRYLCVFDKLRLAFRTKFVNTEAELERYNTLLIDDRVEICIVPFFRGPKEYLKQYFEIKKALKKSVDGCDAAILRVPSTVAFALLDLISKNRIPYFLEVVANPKELAASSKNIILRLLMYVVHIQQINACKSAQGISYVTKFSLQKIYPGNKKGHFSTNYSSIELSDSFFGNVRSYPTKMPFVICHVSNPIKTYNKGHLTVIKVVKILNDKGYNVIAQFAGNGDFITLFKNYAAQIGIAHKINFIGLLEQKQLKEFLDKSDLMLFPTHSEGLPRAIIEAMATGLPCLSTSVGGIPELIPSELIFSPSDIMGFVTKIAEIIDNPFLYIELSKAARENANEYASDILQSLRIDFYQKLRNIS